MMVKIRMDLFRISFRTASSTWSLVSLAISTATCDWSLVSLAISTATCDWRCAASVLLSWKSYTDQFPDHKAHTKCLSGLTSTCSSPARFWSRFKESR